MALKRNNAAPSPTSSPDTGADVETDVPMATDPPTGKPSTRLRKGASPSAGAPAPEVTPEVLPPEETKVEAPVETAVAARPAAKPPATSGGGMGLSSPFDSLEGNIPPGELTFGSIPRYTASNGQVMNQDKKLVGSWIQFEPVSWNYSYMMAPNSKDEEAKEFLKFSYDNEMCTDGSMTLQQALKEAQEAGYTDASIKRYIELFGIVLSAEKLPDNDPALNKLAMLSLSPESVKAWNGFKVQAAVQVKMGKMKVEDLKVVTATVVVKTYSGNTFSCFNFE